MNPIICKDAACGAVLMNPCGMVQALFAFRQSFEQKEMKEEEKKEYLARYQEDIQRTGLHEPEDVFKAYKGLVRFSPPPSKHFVLKCINGHVYTYEISCEQ